MKNITEELKLGQVYVYNNPVGESVDAVYICNRKVKGVDVQFFTVESDVRFFADDFVNEYFEEKVCQIN